MHAHTHARIHNRPPPVGGTDTNSALRCPGAWGAFFAATELLQAAGPCHEQAASSCVHPQEQKNFVLTCAIDLPINLAGTYRDIRLGIAKHRLTIRAIIIVEINLAEPRRCTCLGFSVTDSAQTRKDLLSGSMPMHSTTSNEKAELIKLLSKARKKLDESLLLIASILGEDCEAPSALADIALDADRLQAPPALVDQAPPALVDSGQYYPRSSMKKPLDLTHLKLRIGRGQCVPDSSNHSLYLIKLFNSSYPEKNFGGNQLLDGSIRLSPLYPRMTNDLHNSIATSLHQSFP